MWNGWGFTIWCCQTAPCGVRRQAGSEDQLGLNSSLFAACFPTDATVANSEDPYLAGKMAAGYIRGIQKNGVSACPKHFACSSQELRRMASNSIVDERTLREIYLAGFEIAVKEGEAKSLVSSYNRVNGVFATEKNDACWELPKNMSPAGCAVAG